MGSGAHRAGSTLLRRLAATAVSRHLHALVVPGPEVLRARRLDLEGLGVAIAASPRHADVLIVVGALPGHLRDAAAVAYAQMPRPRAILAIDAPDISPLPGSRITAKGSQTDLAAAVRTLRDRFARDAFAERAGDSGAHGGGRGDAHGDAQGDEQDGSHGGAHGGAHADGHGDGHDGRHGNGHGNGHGGHGSMGFMSMLEVTRDLPRGRDGLPMDRSDVPFGPLFPGLPGGLLLTLTLAGDSVTGLRAGSATGPRPRLLASGMRAAAFVDQLSALDPLAPVAYRLLACRALEAAAGSAPTGDETGLRIAALERERAASHLSWLWQLGRQLGLARLRRRAARLQRSVLESGPEALARLVPEALDLQRRLERTPLLRARLAGIGRTAADGLRGPAARAAGRDQDARNDERTYAALGFAPVRREAGDALARLQLRLDEIVQSLALAAAPAAMPTLAPDALGALSGSGDGAVETSRGEARLHVRLEDGLVTAARLDAPSARCLDLLPDLATGLELGDALVMVGSFDISPWEAGAA